MSTRRTHTKPTFSLIETDADLSSIEREIAKVKPKVEITLEGMDEIATGKIIEWHSQRHFFAVKWEKRSDAFADKIESRADLRTFFKGHLFSTQLVFKSTTVRRLSDEVYHFRIPEQLFKQQRRGALRVPTQNATLITPQGEFEIIDLSAGGAKLKRTRVNAKVRLGSTLLDCELKLGRKKISGENFGVKITSESDDSLGCRFAGLDSADQITIKHFLMEALRHYYKDSL